MNKLEKEFVIERHDLSIDRSLRSHSAADEFLLENVRNLSSKPNSLAIYHDRFGFLSCHLNSFKPITVFTNKSQLNAIELNVTANQLPSVQISDPLSPLKNKVDFVIMKVPKSLALFQLYLEHITQNSTSEVTVVVSFMTRHFSTNLIQIAEKYFENVEQSRAVKKARIVTLRNKKHTEKLDTIDVLNYNNEEYQQYWGVFSAKHIDYATQYFLKHLELTSTDNSVLDLASGNGVIGKEVLKKNPTAQLHLMDDSFLAVESAKLNVQGENIQHYFNDNLLGFEDGIFDLITTNPPFHFEYEINIKIPLQLFKECYRCLKTNGNLQIVANKHLNYITHLKLIFPAVQVLAQNDNFIIYKCVKSRIG